MWTTHSDGGHASYFTLLKLASQQLASGASLCLLLHALPPTHFVCPLLRVNSGEGAVFVSPYIVQHEVYNIQNKKKCCSLFTIKYSAQTKNSTSDSTQDLHCML